jgi:hypothetical protein
VATGVKSDRCLRRHSCASSQFQDQGVDEARRRWLARLGSQDGEGRGEGGASADGLGEERVSRMERNQRDKRDSWVGLAAGTRAGRGARGDKRIVKSAETISNNDFWRPRGFRLALLGGPRLTHGSSERGG